MLKIERDCPKCSDIIIYKTKSRLNEAIKNNRSCRKCGWNKIKGITKYNNDMVKKRAEKQSVSMRQYRKNNPPWNKGLTKFDNEIVRRVSDNQLGRIPWNKGKIGVQIAWNKGLTISDSRVKKYSRKRGTFNHSEKTKEYLRNLILGKTYEELYGKKKAAEIKRKLRINTLKRSKKHKIFFNDLACEYFDWLNMYMGWNGQHALNGDEYQVGGYSLDYYEPNLNLVIEWDEPYHFKNKKIFEKDRIREQNIINELKCKFYRINQETFEIKEIIMEINT